MSRGPGVSKLRVEHAGATYGLRRDVAVEGRRPATELAYQDMLLAKSLESSSAEAHGRFWPILSLMFSNIARLRVACYRSAASMSTAYLPALLQH